LFVRSLFGFPAKTACGGEEPLWGGRRQVDDAGLSS
jgi:hypothetical protein